MKTTNYEIIGRQNGVPYVNTHGVTITTDVVILKCQCGTTYAQAMQGLKKRTARVKTPQGVLLAKGVLCPGCGGLHSTVDANTKGLPIVPADGPMVPPVKNGTSVEAKLEAIAEELQALREVAAMLVEAMQAVAQAWK